MIFTFFRRRRALGVGLLAAFASLTALVLSAPRTRAQGEPTVTPAPEPVRAKAMAPPKLQTLHEWRRADRELQDAVQNYLEIDNRRQALMVELAKSKKKHVPGDVSFSSIMARRAISGIFEQYDHLLGDFRVVQNKTWQIGRAAHASRDDLKGLLAARQAELETKAKESALAPVESFELDRAKVWLASLQHSDRDGPFQIIRGIVGQDLGFVMLFSHAAQWHDDRGGPRTEKDTAAPGAPRPSGPGANRPRTPAQQGTPEAPLSPEERRTRMLDRVKELRESNDRAKERIDQRNHEIERITAQLEKLNNGTQGAAPNDNVIGKPEAPTQTLVKP